MKTIQAVTGLALVLLCFSVSAADVPTLDGVWLKDNIDAYNRLMAKRETGDDMTNAILISGWLRGVVAASQQSSTDIAVRMSLIARLHGDFKQKGDQKNAERMRVLYEDAKSYVPKFDVPSSTTMDQTTAVVLKYLTNHPEKWQSSAVSLTNEALTEAFPALGLSQKLQ